MKTLRILVLDDELRMQDEIEEFLIGQQFIVHKAGTPSEAFTILDKTEIDILILDIKLGDHDLRPRRYEYRNRGHALWSL
jgi:DNA-binding response OmpR family regulator